MADDFSQTDSSRLTGRTLGQYEIGEELGRGGMATVYLAHQKSIGRTVAIKIIPRQFTHDDMFMQRFGREVKVIADLQHPRVLPVYDYGEWDGRPFIVMAYMAGGTLADRLSGGPLPLDDCLHFVQQIAEGLDHAHRKGVIHRDFKPSNVLLDEHGNAYLADFGIAKINEATIQLTGTGVVGTPAYMAPEMASQGMVTAAVDIYALGVTLFQMLTGAYPFQSETPLGVLMAHATTPVPDVRTLRPDLPEGVANVILRSMAKDPEARYPSAGALARDLADALSGVPIAPPATPQGATWGDTAPVLRAADSTALEHVSPQTGIPSSTPVPPPAAVEQPKRGCRLGVGLIIGLVVALVVVCVGGFIGASALGFFEGTPFDLFGGGVADEPVETREPQDTSAPPTDRPAPTRTPTPRPVDTPDDGGSDATDVRIVNESRVPVCYVYVSPSTDDTWGGDQLGESSVIAAGDSYTLSNVPHGEYDLRADDCDRYTLDVHYRVTFDSSRFDWVIRDNDSTVVVDNRSSFEICYIYISPTVDDVWGVDRLGDTGTLPAGNELYVDVYEGIWDFRAEACDGETYWELYDNQLYSDDSQPWILVDGDSQR